MLKLDSLTINYLETPKGIDFKSPQFSWILDSDEKNTVQKTYRICIENTWDSGVTESDKSTFVECAGLELKPKTHYNYTVTVTDNHNNTASCTSFFETGLMDIKNLRACWIKNSKDSEFIPVFRREFSIEKAVKKATIYATALGVYEIEINKQRVGDAYLTPGFTPMHLDILYQTYDVTNLLSEENAICMTVAGGWTLGAIARNNYNVARCALLQLEIEFDDGTTKCICSDESWKCFDSPWSLADIYNGETYDARLENPLAYMPRFNGEALNDAHIYNYPYNHITSQSIEYIKKDAELVPVSLITTPKGERVLDFGQNISGWVKFSVSGKSGDRVILEHAEVLDSDGNFYTENMRGAKNLIKYTLKGEQTETFEPHFSFQGFRYVKLAEYPGEISLDNFRAYLIHTDYKKTSSFECSDPDINKLYNNVLWGQDDNFIDVPTDCPQRDERMGWTGDA